MVRRLRLNEAVNLMNNEIYENLATLGLMCTVAANDLHHIHLCATGDKFQEIHKDAEDYMNRIRELGDFCLELAKENNDTNIANENYALEYLTNKGIEWKAEELLLYYFEDAYTAMLRILTQICDFIGIIQEMPNVSSDVSSELDTYLREFTKDVNYFISKKLF